MTLPPAPQFAAEPQVAVSPLQCGLFGVTGGQIFGPSGQPFKAQGIDILQSTIGNIVTGPDGGPLLQNFPNTNMVRIAMESGYGPLDQATLNAITWLTAKGIVVELGNYNIFQTAPVGQDLQNEVNWFSQLATEFKNNPYVWFSTANEPQNTPGNASDEQLAVYNAIRATGNTSMVGLDLIGGESPTDYDKSVYAQMSNVHWDAHYYNWQTGYSADLGTNVATLQNEISALAPITDKDGVIPTIVGEFGDATDGGHIDPGGSAAAQAVLDVAPTYSGSTAWVYYWPGNMDAGMPGDELTNQDTGQLTPYGQEIAAGMSPANQPPVCTESPSLAMTAHQFTRPSAQHARSSQPMSKALAVVAFVAVSTQAIAECLSHNPYDPRCTMTDFISPIGTVQWFLNNSVDRKATLIQCASGRFPPPRAWCDNAAIATKIATGGR